MTTLTDNEKERLKQTMSEVATLIRSHEKDVQLLLCSLLKDLSQKEADRHGVDLGGLVVTDHPAATASASDKVAINSSPIKFNVKKASPTKSTAARTVRVKALTITPTKDVTLSGWKETVDEFRDNIRNMTFDTQKDFTVRKTSLSEHETGLWVKLLFNDIFSKAGLERLKMICKEAVNMNEVGNTGLLAERALYLSGKSSIKLETDLLNSVKDLLTSERKKGALEQYLWAVSGVEVVNVITEAETKLTEDNNNDLKRALRAKGFQPKQGQRWSGVVREFYCSSHGAGLTSSQLRVVLTDCRPLYHLSELFGPGVFLLLPNNAGSRFKELTKSAVRQVGQHLSEICPEVIHLSQYLSEQVCPALTRASRKDYELLQRVANGLSTKGSNMLECVEDAITDQDSDTEMEG